MTAISPESIIKYQKTKDIQTKEYIENIVLFSISPLIKEFIQFDEELNEIKIKKVHFKPKFNKIPIKIPNYSDNINEEIKELLQSSK